MKNYTGPMHKAILSLMSQNIKILGVDIDGLIDNDEEAAIKFLQDQYSLAEEVINNQSQS